MAFPGWNSPASVQAIHASLEGGAVLFFAALVLFDVLAHLAKDNSVREKYLERLGLACFAIAVLGEILAYPYSQRNDELSARETARLNLEAEKAMERASLADERASRFSKDAEDLRKQVASANERTARAEVLAKGFEVQIEAARRDAAKASEETARITKENLSLQTEVLRLAKNVGDRVFTPEQRAKFMASLNGKPKFPIAFSCPDGEPVRYARQLMSAFPGWDINSQSVGIATLRLNNPQLEQSIFANGLGSAPILEFSPTSNRPNVATLSAAFEAAGIKIVRIEETNEKDPGIRVYIPLKAPE